MINPISIALSGISSASRKAGAAASNIVNADSVGSRDAASPNQPYQPVDVIDKSLDTGGVQAVTLNRSPAFVASFAPDSPFADTEGLVNAPNINTDEELMTLKKAEQAYKANAQVIRTSREMQDSLLDALD